MAQHKHDPAMAIPVLEMRFREERAGDNLVPGPADQLKPNEVARGEPEKNLNQDIFR